MSLPSISRDGVSRAAWESRLTSEAKHLSRSDKGRDALERVLDWLESSGLSLDGRNQQAILTLLENAWGGYAGTVRDVMHEALGHYS